jgi:hypothetical protein
LLVLARDANGGKRFLKSENIAVRLRDRDRHSDAFFAPDNTISVNFRLPSFDFVSPNQSSLTKSAAWGF